MTCNTDNGKNWFLCGGCKVGKNLLDTKHLVDEIVAELDNKRLQEKALEERK